jgi:hypothetical protein
MGTLDGFCRCILDNTAALEITLWHDANGDGQQEIGAGDECGEDPLDMDEAIFQLLDGGVPATDVNGNPVIFVNVGGGVYRAENLAPGSNYTVLATPDAAVSWQITQAHFDGSVADVGDSDVDSDFDPLTGLSPVFEIVPGNTKVNIDLGMWQSLTLGGTVFLSYDCIQCTYSGPPNQYFATDVLVNLWGENPVGSGIFTLNLGQVQTSIGGIYEFTNLSPGDYRIEVDHTAFQSGGQFEVFMPLPLCDLPNNDLSHQNDGEGSFNASGGLDINFARLRSGCEPNGGGTENRTFDFGVCNEFDCTLSGQQFTEPQCTAVDPTDPNHNPIFPICDLFILDNFCSTMTTGNSPGNQPSPLCANGGVPHNTSWFSFVAGEGDYQIEITPGNCQNVGGAIGFASGIYTDCSFSQEVQCEGACTTAPITFTSQDPPGSGNYLLEPCEVYYWFLDGCNGSVCDYEVQILGNFSSCDPHAPTDLVCTGNLGLGSDCLNSLCTGESVVLELEDVELEGMTYNWSVMPDDGQWTINNSDPDANVTTQTIDPFLDITFDPALGPSSSLTYTVCWENLQSKCIFKAGPICRDIVIADLDEDFGTVTVCESDLFAYPGPEFDENGNSDPNGDGESGWQCVMGFVPGVNTCDAVTPGGCQYTQTVFVVEALNSAPERFDTVVCDEWSLHGIDFPAENYIERPFFLSPDILNVNGCDTFIDLYAWYMHMDGLITLDCASGVQPPFTLTLDTFNVSDASPDTTTLITVDWYRPDFGIGEGFELLDGDPDANPFTFSTNRSGEWVAIVTMTVVIEAGSDTLPGCEFVFSIDVDPSTFVIPGDPVPGPWDLMPDTTNGQPVQYTITSGTGDTPMWLWPSDVTSATGQGTDTLTIDWTGSSGGELAVFASNGCGVSDTISAEVTPFGQDCDRLFIELDLLYDVDSTNVCVDVNVNCFDSMELVQFSLRWDPNVINYQPPYIIEFGGDTTLITASAIAINESNADNGVLITQWLSPSIDLEGLSLEDGSTILRFCFSIIGDPCTSTRIRMSDNPTNIEFIQTNGISWTSEDINASSDLIQVEPGDLAVLASNCSTSPGNDDGNIRFSACGAGGPYTWLINGVPGTDPDSILSGEEVLISDLANGEYTIVVTDANGDTASTIVQIETGSSGVTFDLNGIDPNCFYRENGQIELSNVSSTLDIIETAWSTGDFNTNRVRGLGPGIYTVSLTDEVGCVTVRSDTLMVDTIMATFTIVDSADCAGELGLVTAQASGGIPLNGDLYFFNGVFPMSNYSESFPAGPFEIIVSDDVGCEITLTGEMPISSRDVSLGTIGIMPSDTVVCINAPAFDLTWSLTGGLQDSSGVASWSGTGIIDASLGTFDPAVSGVGEFSIMLEYAEGPDGVCSYLASSTVTVIVDASCVTDVDDVDEQAAAIIIYPNPATDLIHIEGLSQQHSIVVYDIYGRPMPLPANGDSLDLTNLPRGLYILSVHDQDGLTHAVRRFVKQ